MGKLFSKFVEDHSKTELSVVHRRQTDTENRTDEVSSTGIYIALDRR